VNCRIVRELTCTFFYLIRIEYIFGAICIEWF